MAKARAKGRLKGKQPKLPLAARKTIHRRYHDPDNDASPADLADEIQRRPLHNPPHHQRSDPTGLTDGLMYLVTCSLPVRLPWVEPTHRCRRSIPIRPGPSIAARWVVGRGVFTGCPARLRVVRRQRGHGV